MSKSEIHLANDDDSILDSSSTSNFSDQESNNQTDSDRSEKVKKISTRHRSRKNKTGSSHTTGKRVTSENLESNNSKSVQNNIPIKSSKSSKSSGDVKLTNSSKISNKPAQKVSKTPKQTADMKDALKSIHIIESDVEHDTVKLTKKKLMEREAELKRRQLPSCPASKAFRPGDIQRIVQHTTHSIFDKENCALWTGYITNLRNKRKGTYVNFYFRNKKKVALHRLLYANFKGEISADEYIKYSCQNKGRCCNVNHMVKFEYNAPDEEKDIDDIDDDDVKSKPKQKQETTKTAKTAKSVKTAKTTKSSNQKKKRKSSINESDFKISIY